MRPFTFFLCLFLVACGSTPASTVPLSSNFASPSPASGTVLANTPVPTFAPAPTVVSQSSHPTWLTAATSCLQRVGPTTIDYAPIVQLNGITYLAQNDATTDGAGRSLAPFDIGAEFARVKCKIQDTDFDSSKQLEDGYAAHLEAGTPLYIVRGYRPAFRLAVHRHGHWRLFEADLNPTAVQGADLLDLHEKVQSIEVRAPWTDDG